MTKSFHPPMEAEEVYASVFNQGIMAAVASLANNVSLERKLSNFSHQMMPKKTTLKMMDFKKITMRHLQSCLKDLKQMVIFYTSKV